RPDRGPGPAAADLHPERDRPDFLRTHPAQGQRRLRRGQFQGPVRKHRARPDASRSYLTRCPSNGCRMRAMSDVAVLDETAIMAVLDKVMDPEIRVVSITDLGIVRGFADSPPRVRVTPTYTGCPATIAIERLVRDALDDAGFVH